MRSLRTKINILRPTALNVAFLATLLLLLCHIAVYHFLTDDAFISFRYAQNLAAGNGLVFNPGLPPVEGYTNFLWVVLLAAFSALGLPPESVANSLSVGATILLWGFVVLFSLRSSPEGPARWWAVVPALLLATSRSFAVWSTGGLETRLFELLVFAGTAGLIHDLDSTAGSRRTKIFAAMALGLATLTRPEGLLFTAVLYATAWAWRLRRNSFSPIDALLQVSVYGGLVGAHLTFRLLYYGQWLPNTFYAKVGASWWDMGTSYFTLFAIEYAAWLWIPLLCAALVGYRREKRLVEPLFFTALILPHATYVAYLGGDHFEYRPLDIYLPYLFLMIAEGLRTIAHAGRKFALASVAYLALILLGAIWIPWQTHRKAPATYLAASDLVRSMDPDYDPLYRLFGLRILGKKYQEVLDKTFRGFVGIRQEGHRLFLAMMIAQGKLLRSYVSDGRLPADTRIAVNSVGALPYYSGFMVMDRHGLTDAQVARSKSAQKERRIAHEKYGTITLAREEGIDLYSDSHVLLVLNAANPMFRSRVVGAFPGTYVARMGEGNYLLAQFPMGETVTLRKFPRLNFRPLWMPAIQQQIIAEAIDHLFTAVERTPADADLLDELSHLLYLGHRPLDAVPVFKRGLQFAPDNFRIWEGLANSYCWTRLVTTADSALEQAAAAARRSGDQLNADRLANLRCGKLVRQ